jgi:hypothetical protein
MGQQLGKPTFVPGVEPFLNREYTLDVWKVMHAVLEHYPGYPRVQTGGPSPACGLTLIPQSFNCAPFHAHACWILQSLLAPSRTYGSRTRSCPTGGG